MRGTVLAGADVFTVSAANPDPAAVAAELLRARLEEAGIQFESGAEPSPGAEQTVLARHQSAPLAEIIEHTHAASDNLEAQCLFLTVGLRRGARHMPLLAYVLPIALIVALFTQALVLEATRSAPGHGVLWLVGLLCVIAFSELGVAMVNWAATLLATPRTLPRLDYSEGIPDSARTLVVVPTMFGSAEAVQHLAEALEEYPVE
jgi:hypothetical protein